MHAKEKQKCQTFLNNLKSDPEAMPFLVNFENNPSYYFDFDAIAVNPSITMSSITTNLKNNKYKTVKDFYKDLKTHF
jgi:hypothetical protein